MLLEYQFTQSMWSKELDMTNVLFNIQQIVKRMKHDVMNQKYGKDKFY